MSTGKKILHAPSAMDLVLGAGGAKGYGHIGVYQAIEELQIRIASVYGVSIGSIVAAFICNGFSSADIAKIFASENFMAEGARTLNFWRYALTTQALQRIGFANLGPTFQKVVRKYKLRPQKNLNVLSFNVKTLSPVLFTGTDYDLAMAVSASCAVPLVMQPVVNSIRDKASARTEILVDGFLHHTHPTSFCKNPAIVSKLGFASKAPTELLPLSQIFLHLAEQLNSPILNWLFDDPVGEHILIESGMPDVGALSFSSSPEKCQQMILHGKSAAEKQLKAALKAGRLAIDS